MSEKNIENKNQSLNEKRQDNDEENFEDDLGKHPKMIRQVISSVSQSLLMKESPVKNQITEEHINKLIDNDKAETKLQYEDNKSIRKFLIQIISMFTFSILIIFAITAYSAPELMSDVISLISVALGGVGAGFGIKSLFKKDHK